MCRLRYASLKQLDNNEADTATPSEVDLIHLVTSRYILNHNETILAFGIQQFGSLFPALAELLNLVERYGII